MAQKDHTGAKIALVAKIKGKYMSHVIFWMHAAPVPVLLQVAGGSSTFQLGMSSEQRDI